MLCLSSIVRSLSRLAPIVAIAVLFIAASANSFSSLAQSKIATTGNPKSEAMAESSGRVGSNRGKIEDHTGVASGDSVRVIVRSYETAAIGAEINARITRLPEREGDRFRKGDVIVEFDCSKIIAEHSAATAILRAHQAVHDNQRQLLRYKATGTLAVDQSRFEMEKAQADVEGLVAKRAGCTIHAPFDGRAIEKAAQIHEIAQPNQPLIRIINETKLEMVLMVPSAWLGRVPEGASFLVKIDETGETHEARIVQSTGAIDPVSQSARLIAEIVKPVSSVLPGMSGTALFSRREGSK